MGEYVRITFYDAGHCEIYSTVEPFWDHDWGGGQTLWHAMKGLDPKQTEEVCEITMKLVDHEG